MLAKASNLYRKLWDGADGKELAPFQVRCMVELLKVESALIPSDDGPADDEPPIGEIEFVVVDPAREAPAAE